MKTIIVDIDGTLADHEGVRSPFDESRVFFDKPVPAVIKWVQELSKDHNILIVSGRHETCAPDTILWLENHNVPFDGLFMRGAKDNRSDTVVKYEILRQIIDDEGIPLSDIEFVLDDRPKVINMWRQSGLTVYPVRGAIEDF